MRRRTGAIPGTREVTLGDWDGSQWDGTVRTMLAYLRRNGLIVHEVIKSKRGNFTIFFNAAMGAAVQLETLLLGIPTIGATIRAEEGVTRAVTGGLTRIEVAALRKLGKIVCIAGESASADEG